MLPQAQDARRGETSAISVVVASCRERRLLDACLRSLLPQCHAQGAEIVVVRNCDLSEINDLAKTYPSVRFVAAPVASRIPHLRAAGMAAAKGDSIALTEDHCVVAPDWLAQLVRLQQQGADVVGGAMDNAQRERAIDWAAYFAEYGFFAQNGGHHPSGPLLTAANVAYNRSVVKMVRMWAEQGEWENVIHADLMRRGSTLQFLSTASVYQNKNYRFWDFCCDRFVHGRDYARRRLMDTPIIWRWFYLPGTLVLPVVLTIRVARAINYYQRWPFFRALPITLAFFTAWAAGEAVGYWYGRARSSTDGA